MVSRYLGTELGSFRKGQADCAGTLNSGFVLSEEMSDGAYRKTASRRVSDKAADTEIGGV